MTRRLYREFRAFTRLYQVMVVAMALLTAWNVVNLVTAAHNGKSLLYLALYVICGVVDGALVALWWRWGVEETLRHQRLALLARWFQEEGDQS